MPILYSNKNNTQLNMKQLNEMTQLEATDWIKIKNKPVMDGYTMIEANRLTELVKAFIDPKQRSCAYCGTTGNLREAKDKFVRYYIENEQVINKIANNTFIIEEVIEEPLTSLDVAIIASEVIEEMKEEVKKQNKKNKKSK